MTKTISPRDTLFNTDIAGLVITLNENGKFKEIISYNQSTGIYEGSTIPAASNKYQLLVKRKVNQPDEVTVENTLPKPFVLKNIYFKDMIFL